MRGFSKAIIAGNLTRDPELRNTTSGRSVCSFAIAVNRTYRDANGEQKDEVSYIDCTAWAQTGETISKWLKKGSPILVSGRLQQRSWDDKATGAKRSRVEVVVEDFTFLGGGRDSEGFSGGAGSQTSASAGASKKPASPEVVPEDIPEGEISIDEIPF